MICGEEEQVPGKVFPFFCPNNVFFLFIVVSKTLFKVKVKIHEDRSPPIK